MSMTEKDLVSNVSEADGEEIKTGELDVETEEFTQGIVISEKKTDFDISEESAVDERGQGNADEMLVEVASKIFD